MKRQIRSLRALAYPVGSWRLGSLHHVHEKFYLRRGLSLAQRTQYALEHRHNWTCGDVELWSYEHITITAYPQPTLSGDLAVTMRVGPYPLHRTVVSVLDEGVFIGMSQGCANWHPMAREEFDEMFPHNSAALFTLAAVCGLARGLGAQQVIGVRGHEQASWAEEDEARYRRNYDAAWKAWDGVDRGRMGWEIPLPDYTRPVTGSHPRRARRRRANWAMIDAATADRIRRTCGPSGARR